MTPGWSYDKDLNQWVRLDGVVIRAGHTESQEHIAVLAWVVSFPYAWVEDRLVSYVDLRTAIGHVNKTWPMAGWVRPSGVQAPPHTGPWSDGADKGPK